MFKYAVCDTSTLIRLKKRGVLFCLVQLFEKIYIPQAVKEECRDPEVILFLNHSALKICTVENILPIGLGVGEREAISLAVELEIEIFFTDDDKAIKKARQNNLLPIQTLDLIILSKQAGFLDSVKLVLDKIKSEGDRIEDGDYYEALRQAGSYKKTVDFL